jgi:DNA-directed RNA polymerase specialized sigma24 family protein
MESVADLAARFSCGQSRIKSMLHRTRGKLQKYLREEGLV